MRTRKMILFLGLFIMTFAIAAQAQEQPKKDADSESSLKALLKAVNSITDETQKIVEGVSTPEFTAASKELAQQGKEFTGLLDLESMKKDVKAKLDLSQQQIESVRPFLKTFRGHYCASKSTIEVEESDEWLETLTGEVEDTLDSDLGAALVKWLGDRKKKIDECAKAMEAAGLKMGKAAERWTDEFEGDWEAWGKQFGKGMEKWGERFGEDMEKWGEHFGRGVEHWAESYAEDWEAWGEDFGRDMTRWGEQFGRDMESLALGFGKDFKGLDEKGKKKLHDALKGLSVLEELDWEGLVEQINNAVDQSLKGLENFEPLDSEFQKNMEDFTKAVSRASEDMRKKLNHKLRVLGKERGDQWDEIRSDYEALEKEKQDLKAVRDKLTKERDSIRSREKEIDQLKRQIEELKKEIRDLKRHKENV